jgi:hypothetical protein
MGCSNQAMGPAGGHPAPVLEEGGHRGIPVSPVATLAVEHLDPIHPDRLDQTAHHLQLDQVIGELVDVKIAGVFDDPFLQC